MRLVEPILKAYQEQQHLLIDQGMSMCPADQRIQNWLEDYLHDVDMPVPKLPVRQLKLDRYADQTTRCEDSTPRLKRMLTYADVC
jgi:hypothetical protein